MFHFSTTKSGSSPPFNLSTILIFSSCPIPVLERKVPSFATGFMHPVLGWDHGGSGELLCALYPAGRIATGDHVALVAAAHRLLADPPPPPVTIPQTLAAMQAATLETYADVLAD